jgi:hypothetical protein
MEREILVRGTGEARALPDQASLRVEVTADHILDVVGGLERELDLGVE